MQYYYPQPHAGASSMPSAPVGFLRPALVEIQTARVGRKCGTKDRRPLDPPPVVQLKLYQKHGNTEYEVQNYQALNLDFSGFVCYAELFNFAEASSNINPLPLGPEILVGSTCVGAAGITYAGQNIIVFAFPDISSKLVGDFVLRYKFLNLNPTQPGFPVQTILARCWGNHFQVHASREAPTLEVPTALTKALSEAGIRVSAREQTRGKKRRADGDE